jgi:hypothetical protein
MNFHYYKFTKREKKQIKINDDKENNLNNKEEK